MHISVIGSGNMASAFIKQLTRAGHDVGLVSRNPTRAAELATQYGARVVPASDAAAAEVILLATGFGAAIEALQAVGDLAGKIVIDITNPLSADYMSLTIGHETSAAEQIAAAFPAARIVKAFNTVFAQVLAEGGALADGRHVNVFVAADDADAKTRVSTLAQSMGFAVVDAGGLRNARYLEPLAGLNIYLGYGAGMGTAVYPAWLSVA